jgi:hypothetical protein
MASCRTASQNYRGGPDAFANILHGMGVPAAHLMAWLTILTMLLGQIHERTVRHFQILELPENLAPWPT